MTSIFHTVHYALCITQHCALRSHINDYRLGLSEYFCRPNVIHHMTVNCAQRDLGLKGPRLTEFVVCFKVNVTR